MMRSILVPTDFSNNAMKAALYAAQMAKKNESIVFLLHVIDPVTDSIRRTYPLHEKLQEEIKNNRVSELDAAQKSISRIYPSIRIERGLVRGEVTASILDFAKKNQADLILMGTKGATGLKEMFIGSVTADIISRAKIPVLAIPGEYQMAEPDAIMLATNQFEKNTDLLNKIAELAKLFSAIIHTVVFVDTDADNATDYLYNVGHMNQYMDFLKKSFPDVIFKGEVLKGEQFEETIAKYEEKNEVDIIAMVTYRKSFWERFLRKSVTKKMAFHSKIPVLAIPAK